MCLNPLLTIKENGKIIPLRELAKTNRDMPRHMQSRAFDNKFYERQKSENLIEIPCGKCSECLKSKYMEWLKRIKKELTFHKKNYLLNLTYDNEHKKELNKEDLQKFFKRLRNKYFVRYWYVGELGEKTKRPHYHCIMFGLNVNDLKESNRETKKGYKQYESKEIEKIWKNGLITLNNVDEQTIRYILKYLTKNKGKKDFIYGMSKNPPIGVNPNTIKKDILSIERTKGEKRYYKNHIGQIPELEIENERRIEKIHNIEKSIKNKYIYYIDKKRKNVDKI